jgi:hypothetical protein
MTRVPFYQRSDKRCTKVRDSRCNSTYNRNVRIVGKLWETGIVILKNSKRKRKSFSLCVSNHILRSPGLVSSRSYWAIYPKRELQRRTLRQEASRLLPQYPPAPNVAGRFWHCKRLHFGSGGREQAQYMIEQVEAVLAETFLESLPRTRRLWSSL